MREFTIYLSEDDTNRLYAIMDLQGRHELSGNQFATELLETALFNLFPAVPDFDSAGEIRNPEKYRGPRADV